jgi:hypothetical protein
MTMLGAPAGNTIYGNYKIFKVGGGSIADIVTTLGTPAGASISADILVIDNFVDDLETRLTAARGGYLDELAAANIPADVDAILARTGRHVITRAWFSPLQEEVAIPAAPADQALPTVTLPNIAGTVAAVYAGFTFRMIENTNVAVNELDGAQEIQVNKAGGGWTDAINFLDTQFEVAASTREAGATIIGYTDVSGTINSLNTTGQFQWDEAHADQASLVFNDVQTFLIVSYY